MPLSSDEVARHFASLLDLAAAIQAAKASDSSGGKRITKRELRGLALRTMKIGLAVLADVID